MTIHGSFDEAGQGGATGSRGFLGYRRPDGRVGIRNHVLILSPTGLTMAAAQRAAAQLRGSICIASGYGRGQVGADAALHSATLTGLACNPNIAAVVVLAPSPEIEAAYVDAIARCGKPVVGLNLPAFEEDALALADAATRQGARLARDASDLRREPCSLSDLCLAVECGHSDATSGLVCNPAVGALADAVVDAGGQVIVSETLEWTGAEHVLARRAATPEIALAIRAAVQRREDLAAAAGADVRAQNPGPQNRTGGLTTIEEKALGAVAKGGRRTIRGVLGAAQRPGGPGLYLMDTPYFSPESITAMVAAGAQIVAFTTGPGNSYSSLVAPTLKVCANPSACSRLTEQVDVALDGAILEERDPAQAGRHLLERIVSTASGTLTYGEILGEGAEVVSRIGPSL
jgi:altronate dehydratase large subunit